jgi:uncharacterized protein (TIGR02217 family)
MTAFRDELFPTGLAYGFRGGPMFNTSVLELNSGFEKRNINWGASRARYDISHLMKKPDKFAELLAFFMVMQGRAYSFKFWDNKDDTITAQNIGTGDGTKATFQFKKRYTTTGYFFDRYITKLQSGTVSGVTVGDVAQTEAISGANTYSLDLNTGKITFHTIPPNGTAIVIGSAKFYVHVRFDTDELDSEYTTWEAISWGSILLIEVREAVTL